MGSKSEKAAPRPEVFAYADFNGFLRDWMEYLKSEKYSLRHLARDAGLASGYLPMVLSGQRPLSARAFEKLSPLLRLRAPELKFLELLRTIAQSEDPSRRLEALGKVQRYESYKAKNLREIEVYRYLTRWHYVAVREMALLPGFKADPSWIQSRLRGRVPLADISAALDFLETHKFLTPVEGTLKPSQRDLDCTEGVYKISLAQFHRQMLSMASEAIDVVPRAQRSITGQTVAVGREGLEKIKKVLDDALNKIGEIAASSKGATDVYHVALAAFPLTAPQKEVQDEDQA
jgi:uncharacterized protein (TIGR02147 family)